MELFAKIVNGLKPLTIFAKHFIVDVFMGSECASESTFTQPAFTYSRSRSGVFIVNFEHILHLVLVFIDGLCSIYTSLFEHWRCLSLTKKCFSFELQRQTLKRDVSLAEVWNREVSKSCGCYSENFGICMRAFFKCWESSFLSSLILSRNSSWYFYKIPVYRSA